MMNSETHGVHLAGRSFSLTMRSGALALARVAVFVVSWLLLAPTVLYGQPVSGLDPSWNIGIQLAVKNGLTFGKDIIFTYGPLGYLATRLPIGASVAQYLAFDILVMAVTSAMLVFAVWRARSYWQLCLVFLVALVLSGYLVDYASGVTTLLLLVALFLLLYATDRRSLAALGAGSVISLVVLHIKLNVGLVAAGAIIAFLVYQLAFPHHYSRRFSLIFLLAYLAAIVAVSWVLNTDWAGYIISSLYIIGGHNEAMYLHPGYPDGMQRLTMAVVLMIGFVLATIGNLRDARRDPSVWFAHGLAAVFMYESFKHGFTRADIGHNRVFFVFSPAMIGLLYLFVQPKAQRRLGKLLVVALIFSAAALGLTLSPDHLASKIASLKAYVSSVQEPMTESVPDALRRSQALPEDVLALIGEAGVDIMPWEISVIYANDLHYNPRPIIHSYDVYGAYLDGVNAAKYSSEDAPAFVLFFVGDIDERHPFSTESHTKLAMLANYEVIRRFDQYLLLQKRAQPRPWTETVSQPERRRLGENIPLERGGIQLIEADIGYSPLGRLMTTLYQPPPLNITVAFPNGEERTYRAVRGIVNGGMLVNPFVNQLEQADLFFDLGQGRQVAGIRFKSPAPWAYRDEFTYRITQVDTPPDSARLEPLGRAAAVVPGDTRVVFDGWHFLESQTGDTCQWSDGHSARLFFRVDLPADDTTPEVIVDIKAGTFYSQTIPLLLNGAPLGVLDSATHWEPAVYSFSVQRDLLTAADGRPQVNELEFVIPDASSPASLDPANGDTRLLGLCLWEVRLR